MLPALPTGRKWKSGASPSTSMISKAAVFCPSMRTGLMELTISIGLGLAELAHEPQGVVKIAVDGDDLRAVHEGLGQFAEGDFARGQQDDATRCPARAA